MASNLSLASRIINLLFLILVKSEEHGVKVESQCSFVHLVVAHEDLNGGIELVVTSSSSSFSHQTTTVFFPNESFPEECGPSYIRCNLTLLRDAENTRVVVVLPVVRGAALAMFSTENNTMLFLEQYVLEQELELPSYNCHFTNFFDRIETVIGLCFNFNAPDPESRVVRYATLTVDFNNLNSSTFDPSIFQLDFFVLDTSQTVFFETRAQCLVDDADRLYAFTVVADELVFLHFESGPSVFEMFNNHDESSQIQRRVDCIHPRRLVRISNNILVAYCENSTIKVDVCISQIQTIAVTELRLDQGEGVRYYCSSDRDTFVTEKNRNLTITASEFGIPPGYTSELPPSVNDIYIGDCLVVNGGLYFVVTSNNGQTHLIDLLQGTSILLGGSDNIVPHVIYNNRNILYRNTTHSLLYNTSCPLAPAVLEVNVPYQLSAYFESQETYACVCEEPIMVTTQAINDTDTTPEAINSTTTEPTTEPSGDTTGGSTSSELQTTASTTGDAPTISDTTGGGDTAASSELQTIGTTTGDAPTIDDTQGGGLSSALTALVTVPIVIVVFFLIVLFSVVILYKNRDKLPWHDNVAEPVSETATTNNSNHKGTLVNGNSQNQLFELEDGCEVPTDAIVQRPISAENENLLEGGARTVNEVTVEESKRMKAAEHFDSTLPMLISNENGSAHEETGHDKNRTGILLGHQPPSNTYTVISTKDENSQFDQVTMNTPNDVNDPRHTGEDGQYEVTTLSHQASVTNDYNVETGRNLHLNLQTDPRQS